MPKKVSAVKTPKVKKVKQAPAPAAALIVAVEYPLEGERVAAGHYAVRIAAEGAVEAEVSVDGGSWQPCRESIGFFWYDWQAEGAGAHTLAARAKADGGSWVLSHPRLCELTS